MKRMVDNAEKLEKIGDNFDLYDDGSSPYWNDSLVVTGKLKVSDYITGLDFSAYSCAFYTLADNASITKIYDDASGNSFCSVKAVGMTPNMNLSKTISRILSQRDVSIRVTFVLDGITYSIENITMKVNASDNTKYDMVGTTMLMKGISEPINNVKLKMRRCNFYYGN